MVHIYNGSANGNDEALTHTTDAFGNVYAAGKILRSSAGFDVIQLSTVQRETIKYTIQRDILSKQDKSYNL